MSSASLHSALSLRYRAKSLLAISSYFFTPAEFFVYLLKRFMHYLNVNTWCLSDKCADRFPYEIPEDLRANRNYGSFATFSKQGVLSMNYVCSLDYPVNPYATQKKIGRALSALFGSKRYICVATQLKAKTEKFKFCLEYYTRLSERPSQETMIKVPEIIKDNAVESLFIQKDQDKEIMGVYSYSELPGSQRMKYEIIRQCQGRGLKRKNGRDIRINGGIWEYA